MNLNELCVNLGIILTILIGISNAYAEQVVPTSCETLGYNNTKDQCSSYIVCPFDTTGTKVNCIKNSSKSSYTLDITDKENLLSRCWNGMTYRNILERSFVLKKNGLQDTTTPVEISEEYTCTNDNSTYTQTLVAKNNLSTLLTKNLYTNVCKDNIWKIDECACSDPTNVNGYDHSGCTDRNEGICDGTNVLHNPCRVTNEVSCKSNGKVSIKINGNTVSSNLAYLYADNNRYYNGTILVTHNDCNSIYGKNVCVSDGKIIKIANSNADCAQGQNYFAFSSYECHNEESLPEENLQNLFKGETEEVNSGNNTYKITFNHKSSYDTFTPEEFMSLQVFPICVLDIVDINNSEGYNIVGNWEYTYKGNCDTNNQCKFRKNYNVYTYRTVFCPGHNCDVISTLTPYYSAVGENSYHCDIDRVVLKIEDVPSYTYLYGGDGTMSKDKCTKNVENTTMRVKGYVGAGYFDESFCSYYFNRTDTYSVEIDGEKLNGSKYDESSVSVVFSNSHDSDGSNGYVVGDTHVDGVSEYFSVSGQRLHDDWCVK